MTAVSTLLSAEQHAHFAVSYDWLTRSSDEISTKTSQILVLVPPFGQIFVIVLVSLTKISNF